MAEIPKSKIIIAHLIAWGGAVACSLVLTYGTHGPARHPKMLLICLLLVAAVSASALRILGSNIATIIVHAVLWCIAGITAFVLANTSVGVGIDPIATTVVLLLLGAISIGVLARQ